MKKIEHAAVISNQTRIESANENVDKIKKIIEQFNPDDYGQIVQIEMALSDLRRLYFARQAIDGFVSLVKFLEGNNDDNTV